MICIFESKAHTFQAHTHIYTHTHMWMYVGSHATQLTIKYNNKNE